MQVDSNTKVEELGYLLRMNGFSLGIEFGSGGYAVSITDLKTKVRYVEYSHDLLEAIKCVFSKALGEVDLKNKRDDITIPATPKSKMSIKELSKLLSSGSKKNVKY